MPRPFVLASAVLMLATALPTAAVASSHRAATFRGADAPEIGYARLDRVITPDELGVAVPGALGWDARADALLVRDLSTGRTSLVTTLGRVITQRADELPRTKTAVRDPRTGHRFTLDASGGRLLETDAAGTLVSTRDVSEAQLSGVQGMTFAPSGDPTDDPDQLNLFISASGRSEDGASGEAGVFEIALDEPVVSASLAAAGSATASLEQTINTSVWNPASPDPSGLAYIPSIDRLVEADGEVDETTGAGWHNINVWTSTRDGVATGAINTKTADPVNNEPVGAAYDSARGELYLSKDGDSSRAWVYRLEGTSFVLDRSFSLATFGISDAEGIGFGNDTLFVADGTGKEIWRITGGENGIIDGVGDSSNHWDTSVLGLSDPEGIDVDPVTGNLWIVSRRTDEGFLETTQGGAPLRAVDYNFSIVSPAGVAIAPPSDGSGGLNVWIAARGVDNGVNSNENDGRIYEVAVGAAEPPPPPPDPGQNVIVNGGFEAADGSGVPSAWSQNAAFRQSSAVVHTGSFAGRHSSSLNNGYTIQQDAPAVGGLPYEYVGYVNAPATSDPFKVILKVQWRNSDGKISVVTIGKVTSATNGWREFRVPLTAPASATTARVMMVVSSLNTTVYVDDLSLASQ